MYVIHARNVQDALNQGMMFLERSGVKRGSRNGEVLVAVGPVTTCYDAPRERVLFLPERDANPFFHLFEGLWMLNGNRDVAPLVHYVRRMSEFSDDGVVFHGAYGHRWQQHFSFDQLDPIMRRLRQNEDDRRCVLQIWDARADLDQNTRDMPCNTQVYFSRDWLGRLDMTVCNRSNDIIWGAYGANAVHFSMLQEFMAAGIGCDVGRYWQVSNNYHAYTKTFLPLFVALNGTSQTDHYLERVRPAPMVSIPIDEWRTELHGFMNGGEHHFTDPFFTKTAVPMRRAYDLYRREKLEDAIDMAGSVAALDWNLAACEWLERRLQKRRA